jgi:hypothetical protein
MYQNGDDYTDFLDIIGTSPDASARAIAKRLTMGPMDPAKSHYKADLAGFTIDNYINVEDGYPSDAMMIHVWEAVNGEPGRDLIKPFELMQAGTTPDNSYEITVVDLRPYSDVLSAVEGDIFVGFTSAGDQTCLLYEVAATHSAVAGYVAFERSWLGNGDADDNLTWTHDPASVYHISGIIGNYEEVFALLPPAGLFAEVMGGEVDPALAEVTLTWAANSDGVVDHYNIYRDINPNFVPVTPIATVPGTDPTMFVDNALTPGEEFFYYKVTAVDGSAVESTPSRELEVFRSGIEEMLPITTELFQNYPNPFNPDTSIKFSLANTSNVSLTVYNVKGEVASKLIEEGQMKAGYYTKQFKASSLTSGIYYYTLRVDNKVMTKKMMLIK